MGLVTGMGFMAAIGGIVFAVLFFQEAQRLRRLFHRPYAAMVFYLLAAASIAFATGGFILAVEILRAFASFPF